MTSRLPGIGLSRLRRQLPRLTVLAFVGAAYLWGLFEPTEYALMDQRFRWLERPATGGLVVIEIDSRSLRALDSWPWPRSYHARAIDALFAAGAKEIALDIDLSARSQEGDDRALAAALGRAPRRVILPAFAQIGMPPGLSDHLTYTFPAEEFRKRAIIGAVNVFPGSDGLVRDFPASIELGGEEVASSAALLAGLPTVRTDQFYLDFGIRPTSIPHLSYVDVLNGQFDPAVVADKKVLIGATAVELGDQLAVPLHRSLAGPFVQALAYESIVQNRALRRTGELPVLGATLLVVLLLPSFLPSWRRGLLALSLLIAGFYGVALVVQFVAPVSLDITPPATAAALLFGVAALTEIERQGRRALGHYLSDMRRRALMQCVLDDSFDGILIAGHDGVIEVANRAAGRLLALDPGQMIGAPINRFLPGATDAQQHASATRAASREIELTRVDGQRIAIEQAVSRSRFPASGHQPDGAQRSSGVFIHTFRDVTERRRAELALREGMNQALAANRAKSEFLANMSHELRTPLNAIIGFADVIKNAILGSPPSTRYREFAADISNSGTHLLEIINDILDLSMIEAGEFHVKAEPIALDDTIRRCLRIVGAKDAASKLTFEDAIAADLPPIMADPRLLRQIVLNLLSNAVKFTPPGGSVSVSAGLEAGCPVIRIADTGIGIAADQITEVVKPFYQVSGGIQRRYEGTGLGLALASNYLALHGAQLNIASEVGKGTIVTIHFAASSICAQGHGVETARTHRLVTHTADDDQKRGELGN
jgi:signal transduction histidine kinase